MIKWTKALFIFMWRHARLEILLNALHSFLCAKSKFHTEGPPCRHSIVQGQKWMHLNMWNLFKVNIKYQNDVHEVPLVSLLLSFNIFHPLFWCFRCWLWTNKCRLAWVKRQSDTKGYLEQTAKTEKTSQILNMSRRCFSLMGGKFTNSQTEFVCFF